MTAALAAPRARRRFRRGKQPTYRSGSAGTGGRDAWLLVLPALLPIVIFSVYPLLRGIYLGFTDTHAAREISSPFNGLDNYRDLWHYDLFWRSFRIGVIWTLSVTIIQFFASLGLALLLNMDLRLRWVARTLALVPWAMPPVIVAIMWRLMLNPNHGPINQGLRALGFAGDTNWLGDPAWALRAVIVVGVWSGMPQTTITLLAGLQQVDGSLHEAASIDGAGTFKRFWHVTFPAIRPIVVAITTLDLISNFNSFGLVYVMMQNQAAASEAMLPALFAYNEAFQYGNWGLAAAMGNVMVVIVAGFLVFYLRSQAKARAIQ